MTIARQFQQLSTLLLEAQPFWRAHAFQYLQLPWESSFPDLAQRLRTLSLSEAEALSRDDIALHEFLAPYHPLFAAVPTALAMARIDVDALPDIEPRDVPGRKWQQIRHFAPCVPTNSFPVLEWCSGKAHLGRAFAHSRRCAVSALEYDSQLIAAGAQLSAREKVRIDFHCIDALGPDAIDAIRREQNAVALHACGDLHLQLLRLCVHQHTATITLAPCCYHLLSDASRYALSQAAQASGLQLARDDLRTAVQGFVTGSAGENQRRRRLQAWRLGFDALQREVRASEEYLPTPSLSTQMLKAGFAEFCRQVAALRAVELPSAVDFSRYERVGTERLRAVAALDLPRQAFRRALEVWLLLDRALFLREHGYAVRVGTFCERALTPRNLVIIAGRV